MGSTNLVASSTSRGQIRAPFFIIPDIENLNFWLNAGTGQTLYSSKKIRTSEKHVLEALGELAPSTWDSPISADLILPILERKNPNTAHITLKNRISKVAAKLTKLGIFNRESRSITTTRAQYCYEINSPQKAVELLESELSSSIRNSKIKKESITEKQKRHKALQVSLRQRTDLIYPAGTEIKNDQAWSQLLISQLISRASRESLRDRREMIESKLQLGNELIDVVAHTTTRADLDIGGKPGLIAASDAQTFLAVVTIVAQFIDQTVKEGKSLVNRVPIDIVEIVKLLGLPDTGANRTTVIKAMTRIIYTSYTLKFPPGSKAAEALSNLGSGQKVSEIDMTIFRDPVVGIDGDDSEMQNRRWFTLSLNTYIWNMICNGALTKMVHPGLLKEKDGLIHKLHAHLKLYCVSGRKVNLDTNGLYKLFNYKGGIPRFKATLKKMLMNVGGYDPDIEIPDTGLDIEFFGYGMKIVNDPYSAGGVNIEVWELEQELERLEAEREILDLRTKGLSSENTPAGEGAPQLALSF